LLPARIRWADLFLGSEQHHEKERKNGETGQSPLADRGGGQPAGMNTRATRAGGARAPTPSACISATDRGARSSPRCTRRRWPCGRGAAGCVPRARSARPGSRPARAQQLPVAERRVVEELQVVQVPEAIGDHADGLEHVGARAAPG
jgi:hypothetical protein